MANVLVTGAGGALGGHLVRRLLVDGHFVRAVDVKPLHLWWQCVEGVELADAAVSQYGSIDLSQDDQCERFVEGADWIFNLAADMGGMGYIETHRADCMSSVLINTNLLRAARDVDVQRYWFASSACVYAAPHQDTPEAGYKLLREEDAYPPAPEAGYGEEKLFSEQMCFYAGEDWGITTRIARLHNVYGPHSTWKGGREKAPAALCRKVAEAKLRNEDEIEIWGDGKQTRSFTYVDDFAEGALRIMLSDYGRPINLGSEEVVTIDELANIAEECAGMPVNSLERRYNLNAPQGVRGRGSNNALLREVTGWEPPTTLRQGMQKLYDWVERQVAEEMGLET